MNAAKVMFLIEQNRNDFIKIHGFYNRLISIIDFIMRADADLIKPHIEFAARSSIVSALTFRPTVDDSHYICDALGKRLSIDECRSLWEKENGINYEQSIDAIKSIYKICEY